MELVENVRRIVKERRIEDAAGIKPVLKEQIRVAGHGQHDH